MYSVQAQSGNCPAVIGNCFELEQAKWMSKMFGL